MAESNCKLYVCVGQESCIIIVSAHVSGNYAQETLQKELHYKGNTRRIWSPFRCSSSHGTYQNVVMRFYEGTHTFYDKNFHLIAIQKFENSALCYQSDQFLTFMVFIHCQKLHRKARKIAKIRRIAGPTFEVEFFKCLKI